MQGRGYDDNKLDETRQPARYDLDEAAPDHPVIVVNGSYPFSAVNSLALKLAGIDDGSLTGRTAAVTQPFPEDPRDDNLGVTMIPREAFENVAWRAHSAGFWIAVRAIGERGIEMVLDACPKALDRQPRADHRRRIEHRGIPRTDLIDRIARMGALAVSQPIFMTKYGDGFIRHLGLDRVRLTYPFRGLLDAEIKLVSSSDCPVATFEPLKSIEASVAERTGSGRSYALEEAISVDEALPLDTVAGAYATFEEQRKEQIREEMLANFLVLGENSRQVDPAGISQAPVRQTIIGGETVYEA